jgi:hypothetical protein
MRSHWRIGRFWTLVVVFALWIQWWGSWDFPLEYQICGKGEAAHDCESYNVFLFSARRLAETIDPWSVLITAIATGVVATFTATIYIINKNQLAHATIVERSYLWAGFGKHSRVKNGMKWFVTVTNTGRVAGVLRTIRYARITEEEFKAGGYEFETFTDREDVIPPGTPNPGQPTGLDFVIDKPTVCCGWIEYDDIFGRNQKRGWMHLLRLTRDPAGNWSIPFPDCYSANYRPCEHAIGQKRES